MATELWYFGIACCANYPGLAPRSRGKNTFHSI